MIILSVDPGKASGIALLKWSEVKEEKPVIDFSVEVGPEAFAQMIDVGLMNVHANFHVVCERFTINAQTVRNSQAPYSLEQIGVLKHLCRVKGYNPESIIFQSPADAKNMFPNEALKKVGIWHKGGEGHANDALRHALLKFVKSGWMPRDLLD
jgi:hypothetical protein